MKREFQKPRMTPHGSLRRVTATASGVISDRSLKKDVEAYDEVLPRLARLSTTESEGSTRGHYVEPEMRHGGSLNDVTAITSGPGTPSDANLKTEVTEYEAVLPRLRNLK